MTYALYENKVIQDASGRALRLLWLPRGDDSVAVFDIGSDKAMPFWLPRQEIKEQLEAGTMLSLSDDPMAATIRTDSSLTELEKAIRNERLDYIRPLIEDPERLVLYADMRSLAINSHIEKYGRSKKYIYDYLRRWWKHGQLPNALVPSYVASAATRKQPAPGGKKRGRPRYDTEGTGETGVNVTPEMVQLMAVGRRFLKEGRSVQKAYEDTLLENFSRPVTVNGQRKKIPKPDGEIPSKDQFIYHIVRKLERGAVLLAVKGDTSFARKNRPRLGSSKDMAFGPGDIYQIDATTADIYLCSSLNPGRLIGRPILYIVIDVYTRMIVGLHIALSGPSWEVAKMALENAMSDKVEFCARYGVTITEEQWPAQHYCRKLMFDGGSDVSKKNSESAAKGLGYEWIKLPPYRPDLKALVEGRFRLIYLDEIKWAPGASHGRDRDEPKHQLDAKYTLKEFTELMIRYILHYNSTFEIKKPPSDYVSLDGQAPNSLVLWQYGMRNEGGPEKADRERVRANLLPPGTAHESRQGLMFSGLHYRPTQPDRMTMFRGVPGRKWNNHEIRHDPRNVDSILLVCDRGARFESFHLDVVDRRFAGCTLDEVKDYKAREREGERLAAPRRMLSKGQHQADLADLNARVNQRTQGVRLTPASAKGIRRERDDENREIRREDAWTGLPSVPPPPTTAPVVPATLEEAVATPTPGPAGKGSSMMELLIAVRAAELKKMDENS